MILWVRKAVTDVANCGSSSVSGIAGKIKTQLNNLRATQDYYFSLLATFNSKKGATEGDASFLLEDLQYMKDTFGGVSGKEYKEAGRRVGRFINVLHDFGAHAGDCSGQPSD